MMEGIVRPVVTPKTPRLGPRPGVLAATRPDLSPLITALKLKDGPKKSLYMSELHIRDDGVFLCGPFMGAPHAVMLLETLAAWGARQILFLGWCGSLSPDVPIGGILIPSAARIDEGTSPGYGRDSGRYSRPSDPLARRIKAAMEKAGLAFQEGPVWTTDAIFRETPEKVRRFREKGCLAVEMELSALFTVAEELNVALAGILVVSDDLSELTWNPGFKDRRFLDARQALLPVIAGVVESF